MRTGDGALATFVGVVRDNQEGRSVRSLEYEAHEPMAEAQIDALSDTARQRWEIGEVVIMHRLGSLQVGDVSVVIAVAAAHRAPALEACRWLIDTLKAEVPIFKKERFADGSEEWVERDA
jgi:molybdopterin synthase catalytic subunit